MSELLEAGPATDLSDPRAFLPDPPHALWREQRRSGTLHRQERDGAPPFLSVTRYRDVDTVLRDATGFSSEWGMTLDTSLGERDPAAGRMIELTDPPRHQRLRRLVSSGLNRSAARTVDGLLRDRVEGWVERAVRDGETDFVGAVAARVPSAAAGMLLGLPEGEWATLADRASRAVCGSLGEHDPGVGDLTVRRRSTATANGQLLMHLAGLLDHSELAEDGLVRRLLDAELDGDRLTREEVLLNCLNLAIGSNETTKNTLAAGVAAFAAHPGQWQWLRRHPEHLERAIEEVLRWTTPPLHLTRTVLRPVRLAGTALEPGELLCLWIPSANRDEEVFDDPDSFRVDRAVNPHLAFTSGKHFCMGSALARSQLRLVFEALLARVESIAVTGTPARRASNFVAAYDTLPVALTAV
ncbi:cytochrome P450 [Kitasatospora sp. NPDC051853]|uniref:cytochrome P450 n=1 Tax=Kitasatospora sp. NPDC051853 TaxID=3364058 RepID=UPI0037AA1132